MDLFEFTLLACMSNESSGATQLKKAYICSPLHDEDPRIMLDNMEKARSYARHVFIQMHMRPMCPQAWMPLLVNDYDEVERKLALDFGLQLLRTCDCVIVVGTKISKGMAAEIEYAKELGKEILYLSF